MPDAVTAKNADKTQQLRESTANKQTVLILFAKNNESLVKKLKIKLDPWAIMPTRAHDTDAGLDLYAPFGEAVPAGGSAIFNTGVHVQLPPNTAGMLKSKSGLNVNHDITSEGVIDVGYTGSIVVKLYNHGKIPHFVKKGDKISQLVIVPVIIPPIKVVDSLEDTERGSRGFGSTGR